jgi:electron transfer flavoprotein beta subunit
MLGIPCATCVNRITVEADNSIKVERKLEEGIEQLSMPLPALVSVLPDINTARIPTLKQVLGAAKKPVHNVTAETVGQAPEAKLSTVSILAATMDRKQQKFTADEEGIRAAVNALIREGVI